MFRHFLIAALFWAMPGLSAADEDGQMTTLDTLDSVRGWEAVGRLAIGRFAFCTGSLIAPDVVLTAAHCLYDAGSGARISDADIIFYAGYRNGRAAAERRVKNSVVHPDYAYDTTLNAKRVSSDLALIRLAQPIRQSNVTPFGTDSLSRRGAEVAAVSYGRNRAEAPSLQQGCHLLDTQEGVQILSCDVNFGSSGAPVFAQDRDGFSIVSVVSAMAEVDGGKVALAAPVDTALPELKALFDASDGVFRRSLPVVRTLPRSEGASLSGAKFLRP